MGQTDEGFYGRGFYFSNSKETASDYGDHVIECQLDVKNPFYLKDWHTMGHWLEIDMRDDLATLNGMPKDLKTIRELPDGYLLKTYYRGEGYDRRLVHEIQPKPELYGTDREEYHEVQVMANKLSERDKNGYAMQAIVEFNDKLRGVSYDGGLPNWLLQKVDRWNFHKVLENNGYDGLFVYNAEGWGGKEPVKSIDEVDEFMVWNPDQIKILTD